MDQRNQVKCGKSMYLIELLSEQDCFLNLFFFNLKVSLKAFRIMIFKILRIKNFWNPYNFI